MICEDNQGLNLHYLWLCHVKYSALLKKFPSNMCFGIGTS